MENKENSYSDELERQESKIKINRLLDEAKNNQELSFEVALEVIKLALPELFRKYKVAPADEEDNRKTLRWKFYFALCAMHKAFPDHDVRGKQILDLGSGAVGETYEKREFKRHFEPWLARFLHEIGAKPLAVDIGTFEGEPYAHKSVNLLDKDALNFIPDKSIDLVNISLLYDSPQLAQMTQNPEEIRKFLLPQIKRVLREDGSLIEKDLELTITKKADL